MRAVIEAGERAFVDEYPQLDFGRLSPAWGSDDEAAAELRMFEATPARTTGTLRRSAGAHLRAVLAWLAVRAERGQSRSRSSVTQ